MSERYEIIVISVQGILVRAAVRGTHEIIEAEGGGFDEDSLFLAESPSSVPEPITDPEEALERVAGSETSVTSVSYGMPDAHLEVYFEKFPKGNAIHAVILMIPSSVIDEGGAEAQERYTRIARALHEKLHADRTIMGWGLLSFGFRWEEEIKRLSAGEFQKTYRLVDLQRKGD